MTTDKRATSLRLTEEARAMMAELARTLQTSQSEALEIAIRDLHAREVAPRRARGGSSTSATP